MQSSHVAALKAKHAGLAARLHDEQARQSPAISMIQPPKKPTLKLKEEIAAH